MQGKLYLCATPIGNLEDITFRVLRTLKEVDLIAAEDTRNSIKLLNHFDIHTPMTSYHEYNKIEKAEVLIRKMQEGTNIALITDAGTPGISDPGEDLVRLCRELNIPVISVPGPSAVITAAALSGLSVGRFCFEGFLSTNKNERRAHLETLKNEIRTVIFYEAPHKLRKTLGDLLEHFGKDRRICLCRELTKIHEEALLMTLEEALDKYAELEPKGEFVLVLEGCKEVEEKHFWDDMTLEEHVLHYVSLGHVKGEAVKLCAKDRGLPKSTVYSQVCTKEKY